MVAHHIHDALAQVRRLQAFILAKRLFRGYSGRMRMASGAVALLGAGIMSRAGYPQTERAHLLGWSVVLVVCLFLNYGALLAWFLFSPTAGRRFRNLTPAVDALPSLAAGGLLSAALVAEGAHDRLFGVWMCLYGLTHVPYRLSLPTVNLAIGYYYLACGGVCLLSPQIRFLEPWPMGLVFFAGEWVGGFALHWRNRKLASEEAGTEITR
jgi:hypothetical protein